MNRIHLGTARLLTQVAPLVLVDDRLALKGGTAINLFIRDMRVSVGIPPSGRLARRMVGTYPLPCAIQAVIYQLVKMAG
jgi:hypothetical protein